MNPSWRKTEEKVMAECPEERETTIQGILDEMAIKAEQKLGIQRGLGVTSWCFGGNQSFQNVQSQLIRS